MAFKKRFDHFEQKVVDKETGEIISTTEASSYHVEREPDYIKLYLQDVLYLSDMPASLNATAMALLKRITYANSEYGNCVVLAPIIRESIREELGLKTTQSVSNNINKLVRGNILTRIDTNVYRFNPYLFGRGEWADIQSLRLNVEYNLQGRTFSAVVNGKEVVSDISSLSNKVQQLDFIDNTWEEVEPVFEENII